MRLLLSASTATTLAFHGIYALQQGPQRMRHNLPRHIVPTVTLSVEAVNSVDSSPVISMPTPFEDIPHSYDWPKSETIEAQHQVRAAQCIRMPRMYPRCADTSDLSVTVRPHLRCEYMRSMASWHCKTGCNITNADGPCRTCRGWCCDRAAYDSNQGALYTVLSSTCTKADGRTI